MFCVYIFAAKVGGKLESMPTFRGIQEMQQLKTWTVRRQTAAVSPKDTMAAGTDSGACGQTTHNADDVMSGDSGAAVGRKMPGTCYSSAGPGAVVKTPSGCVVMTEAGERYQCSICRKLYSHRGSLASHVRTHSGERPYTCDVCGRSFTHSAYLTTHRRLHTGEKPFECESCGKRFTSTAGRWLHTESTHGRVSDIAMKHPALGTSSGDAEVDKQTTGCDGTVVDEKHSGSSATSTLGAAADMPMSGRTVLTEASGRYRCAVCQELFKWRSKLTIHTRKHAGLRPFTCGVCRKSFVRNGDLTEHARTHTGERPYTCETCGRGFAQRGNLSAHRRIHGGDKPYECEVCGNRFTENKSLASHKRIHSDEKLYVCDCCGRRYRYRADLLAHTAVHTGEKPFKCPVCDERFQSNNHLSKHKLIKAHRRKDLQISGVWTD